jgi:GNAT superfamily N-acetyltransferase
MVDRGMHAKGDEHELDVRSRIRRPRRDELELLRGLERDASRAFAEIGMAEIAADESLSVAELESFRAAGNAWVAVDGHDVAVAYVLSTVIDGCAHVEQVSVAPAHAGRGLGAMLIDHVGGLADAENRPALTLTTFRDVPWNAPYYRRLGFVTLDAADRGPQLAALVLGEAASIPGDVPRVAMRRSPPVLTRDGVRER